ncbi:YfiR family protein [Pseudomonadales bacterium]|nr:YfiR family protein [Pseudomonadales bacterium]
MKKECTIPKIFSVVFFSTLLCFMQPVAAKSSALKAAYVYQFCQYIWWPDDKQDLNIAVVGSQGSEFESIAGSSVDGRVLTVKYLDSAGALDESFDVYFFFKGSEAAFNDMAGAIPKGALTIADEGFAADKSNAVLYLVRVGTKLKFSVNQDVAKLNSIGLSSRLLKVAHPVKKTTVNKGYIKKQGFNKRVSDGVVESLVAIR